MNWLGWSPAALLMLPQPTVAEAQGSAAVQPAASPSITASSIITGEAAEAAETANILENLLISSAGQSTASNTTAAPSAIAELPIPIPIPNRDPNGHTAKLPDPASGITLKRISSTSLEFTSPAQSLSGRINSASGSALFRPGQHLLAGSLTAGNSWRNEVDVSLAVPGLEAIGLTLTAGAYSGRRPLLGGSRTRHGVGELTRWQESNSWEVGVKIAVPDSGIRYSGGVSWSQYSLVNATRFDSRDRLLSPDPRWRSGSSQWHQLEADLWTNASGEASAYAFYGTMDAGYRSYQSRSTSPLVFDGKTFELGGKLRRGTSSFSFSHSSTSGGEIALRETTGRLKTGPVDLTVDNGSWSYRDAKIDGRSTSDRYLKAKARLSLSAILGPGFGSGLLPDSLSLKAQRTHGSTTNLGTQTLRVRTKLGFGFAWSGNNSETEIYLSRIVTDRPGTPSRGPSRDEELALDFSHSLSGDWWDMSVYGSIGDQQSPVSSSKNLSGGADFSLTGKNIPKLSVGFDINRFTLRSYEFGMPDQEISLRDQEIGFKASLDLSRYLAAAGVGQKPYLLIKAYGDWSRSGATYSRDEVKLIPTFLGTFGTRF